MEYRRTLKLALALVVALMSLSSRALAQDDAYRRLAELATQAVTEHRLDDALSTFREMHAMAPSARTLWSLGRVHFERGEYTVALTYLDEALVDPRRPLTDASRDEAVALQARARALTGELVVVVTPEDTTLLVDDVEHAARTLRLDPGAHMLRFERAGFEATTRRVEIRGAERSEVRIQLNPQTPTALSGRIEFARVSVPPHDISLDIVGAIPGLTLHLQEFGDFDLEGTPRPICTAPCTHTLTSGRFASWVSLGDATPQPAGRLDLDTDSRIQLNYFDPGNTPRDVGIAMIITLAVGIGGIILGAWAVNQQPQETGLGVAGLTVGVLGVVVGGLGLAIAFGDGSTTPRAGLQVMRAR